MPRNWRFWRNVTLIGLAHAVLISALVYWSHETKKPDGPGIVWMNGGAGDGNAGAKPTPPPPKPRKISTPAPAPEPKIDEPEEDKPVLTSAKSDIQLPVATPKPSPTPSPKTKATPKPKPKTTPTPTPKPKPKPSPKKMVLAKASPKPKAIPDEKEKQKEKEAEFEKAKRLAREVLAKNEADADEKPLKAVAANPAGSGQGSSSGAGGRAGGAGAESQFGWYGSMLHDRFYSEWVQPTSMTDGEKTSVLVKIRIEKDGRVSNFQVVKSSGNEAVDESVAAVAKRVTQVDPLPAGLGNGEHYDVRINFELNSDQ
jgi:TonB family protein